MFKWYKDLFVQVPGLVIFITLVFIFFVVVLISLTVFENSREYISSTVINKYPSVGQFNNGRGWIIYEVTYKDKDTDILTTHVKQKEFQLGTYCTYKIGSTYISDSLR